MSDYNYTLNKEENKEEIENDTDSIEIIIQVACKAIAGESVTKLSNDYNMYRQKIYHYKNQIHDLILNTLTTPKETEEVLLLNESTIKKTIIACMLICKASIQNTQQLLETVFNIHVSTGKISSVINEAASKAKIFNDSIALKSIHTGANDEIFQGNQPILVGVEPISTYIYLMEQADQRDSTTWGVALLNKAEQGLDLSVSVNDGGSGLNKGVKEAFPNIEIQADVFHAEKTISQGIYTLERKAYKDLNMVYTSEEKFRKSKSETTLKKNLEKYDNALCKSEKSIDTYDVAHILYLWILELFSTIGYNFDEKRELLLFIIEEFKKLDITDSHIKKGLSFIETHMDELLNYMVHARKLIEELSKKEDIPIEVLEKLLEQTGYSSASKTYNLLESEIGLFLGESYDEVEKAFDKTIKQVVKASSMVECINSLIRPYLFLKRTIPNKFLDLLQFYFNTRKYKRSRNSERIGKSPIELLTGKNYEEPLSLLGY